MICSFSGYHLKNGSDGVVLDDKAAHKFPVMLNKEIGELSDADKNYRKSSNTRTSYENKHSTRPSSMQASTMPGLISMDHHLSLPPEIPKRPNSKEPILDYSQRRDYKPLISHDGVCGPNGGSPVDLSLKNFNYESDVFMLMVIKSACGLAVRRNAIRATWGDKSWIEKNAGVKVKLFFLLGDCTNDRTRKALIEENKKHSDILQWQFFDSFRNLTLKECLFLQWYARTCRNVPYIFKGDDDVFVNVKNIVKFLKELPFESRKDLFRGSVLNGSPRILDPSWKYYVSYNLYPEKYYPPYVSGGGFIMSSSVAVRLFQTTLKTRIIPIDDAFLGILLKQFGVLPQNDKTFKSWGMKIADVCRLAKIKTFHKMLPDKLLAVWQDYVRLNISDCDKSSDDVFRKRKR